MPSSSPVKSLLRIAVWIFSKLKAVVTPCSLPEPMMYLPSGDDVHAVGRLAARQQVDEARDLLRVEHLHAADHLALALGRGLLGQRQSTAAM